VPNANESQRIKGNVLDHLGLDPQDALELNLKAELHQHILKLIAKKKLRARDLERILDVPQPRVSELMRGKLSLLSVSKLLFYADCLGAYATINLRAKAA
jgi:predicted XRE-type DNA-binding protein